MDDIEQEVVNKTVSESEDLNPDENTDPFEPVQSFYFKDYLPWVNTGLIFIIALTLLFGFRASQPSYEYKITTIDDIGFDSEINKFGNDGWEVVFARRALISESDDYAYELIFKRRSSSNKF